MVDVPLQHLAVYGLPARRERPPPWKGWSPALARTTLIFRTGKNEIAFASSIKVRPFFRERHDWRYVERLLWSFLEEKSKIYRPWVMRATQGANSLANIHSRIVKAGKNPPGLGQGSPLPAGPLLPRDPSRTECPQPVHRAGAPPGRLERHGPGGRLEGRSGHDHRRGPGPPHGPPTEGRLRGGPSRGEELRPQRNEEPTVEVRRRLRRGSEKSSGMFLWIDSQSLTGVDQQVVRNVGLSLHGRQTVEDLEISRIVEGTGQRDHPEGGQDAPPRPVPPGGPGWSPHRLRTGPAWMDETRARSIFRGQLNAADAVAPSKPLPAE